MSQTVNRADVAAKLQQWQSGEITAHQIHAWAESVYQRHDVGYTDWEGAQEHSVTNEVLARLDFLDGNLIVPEDVPLYLTFLEAPAGQFEQALALLEAELSRIDYDARRTQLRGMPPYSSIVG
jgi:hypothetical protein